MKNNYIVPSERYGHTHYFVQYSDNKYSFVPAEEWMPIYITYNKDGSVYFIDTEGGPCIGIGFRTDEIEVTDIVIEDNRMLFVLKEIEKGGE